MKTTTLVIATMMLALSGCQTCSNWTRSLTGQVKGCFSGLGNCRTGNCRLGGANNVGAPCDAGCESGHAPAANPCQPCGESAGYGSYDGGTVSSFDGVTTGMYDGIPSGATISNVPSTSIPSGSYLSSPSSAPLRGEPIMPKPAN